MAFRWFFAWLGSLFDPRRILFGAWEHLFGWVMVMIIMKYGFYPFVEGDFGWLDWIMINVHYIFIGVITLKIFLERRFHWKWYLAIATVIFLVLKIIVIMR